MHFKIILMFDDSARESPSSITTSWTRSCWESKWRRKKTKKLNSNRGRPATRPILPRQLVPKAIRAVVRRKGRWPPGVAATSGTGGAPAAVARLTVVRGFRRYIFIIFDSCRANFKYYVYSPVLFIKLIAF